MATKKAAPKTVKIKALPNPKTGKGHKMEVGKVYEVGSSTADILVKKKFAEILKD